MPVVSSHIFPSEIAGIDSKYGFYPNDNEGEMMHITRFANRLFRAFLLFTFMLVAAACASDDFATPAALAPIGTYTNQSSRYGVELKLLEDGVYSSSSPGSLVPIQGTYVFTDDQVMFTETKDGHCLDIPGTYKWVLDGKALAFTVMEDQCSLRRIALQSGAWEKQP